MTKISITTQYLGSYTPSEEEFWDEVELELGGAALLLTGIKVETQQEALEGKFRGRKENDAGGMEVIRRRNVSWSFDQLDHYLDLGRALLPRVRQLVEERQFTKEFVRIWMDLQVCHGFLIAHYMDNSDDLTAQRGGLKNQLELASQKKWLCRFLVQEIEKGKTKIDAMKAAVDEINCRIASSPPAPFNKTWYDRMLSDENNDLTSSLREKKLKIAEIHRLASEPADDIPAL